MYLWLIIIVNDGFEKFINVASLFLTAMYYST